MVIPEGFFKKSYTQTVATILTNIMIVAFVLGIISVQYLLELTIIESKLLNFLFIVPVFMSVYKQGLKYGLVICGIVIACHFAFPIDELPAAFSPPALLILVSQLGIFVALSFFLIHTKETIAGFHSEIKEKNEKIIANDVRNNNDIMEILIKVIDAKDSYTYQHSKRVAYYAKCLALSSGLTEEASDRVYLAGLLHDLGKIGLDEKILNKNTKLDDDEKREASRHPIIGARIAENLNCIKDVIPGIYYHHEVYNGSGYPEGLKGDKIPLAARIISIVDAFDAMTSDRSYRVGMPVESAVKRLIENIGNQFDPHLIVMFIDLIKNKSIFIEAKKVKNYNMLSNTEWKKDKK